MSDQVDVMVGRRVRRRRRLLGLTQQELGSACGVSFQQVQKYECGYSRMSVGMLWKLACVLEVEVGYFFSGLPEDLGIDAGRRRRSAEISQAHPRAEREDARADAA